jgi:uncharacterized protein (DUF1697 family)
VASKRAAKKAGSAAASKNTGGVAKNARVAPANNASRTPARNASKLVALIRGINVGRAKRVAMVDLRALVEKLGYGDVRTLLNSGNIVFNAPRANPEKVAARIETAMASDLGVTARVIVLTAGEIDEIVTRNPLIEIADNPSRLLIAVLNTPDDRKKLDALKEQNWGAESFALGTRVAYLWCPNMIIGSPLVESVGRTVRDGVTMRNWATMLKLHAFACSESASSR